MIYFTSVQKLPLKGGFDHEKDSFNHTFRPIGGSDVRSFVSESLSDSRVVDDFVSCWT